MVQRLLGVFDRLKLDKERLKSITAQAKYSSSIGFIIVVKFILPERVERSNYDVVVA